MAIREIVTFPDDRLRKATTPVSEFDDKLKNLVADMFETMYDDEGIGLAAPQIGVSKKVVVIDIPTGNEEQGFKPNPLVLINPKITKAEGTTVYKEGCLSVPEYYEEVERAEVITLQAQNLEGETVVYENVTGLLAICMQHELDHLEGKLFIDYLSTYKREKITKAMTKAKKDKQKQQKEKASRRLAN